jgi:hypothetical protein
VYVHDGRGGETLSAASLPVPAEALSARLFDADATFDERVAARPEIVPAFAAVFGRK